jgi:hypothetical protein
MNFCKECGSTSRDKDGFCGGCGAPWPLVPADGESGRSESEPLSPILKELSPIQSQSSPLANRPADTRNFVMSDIQPKNVGIAVLLAVLLGPFGLLYCTMTGAIVMTFASIAIWLFFGNLGYLIVPAVCAFWAWRAARESASIFD